MRKNILFFCSLLMSLAAWATEQTTSTYLHIHQTDGSVFCAPLKETVLQFVEEKLQLSIIQQTPKTWMLNQVQNITFGDYIQPDTSIEETMMYEDNTYKVLEQGQIIIIKNGVRYNIFGCRLSEQN